jgi:hypothetical protein
METFAFAEAPNFNHQGPSRTGQESPTSNFQQSIEGGPASFFQEIFTLKMLKYRHLLVEKTENAERRGFLSCSQ